MRRIASVTTVLVIIIWPAAMAWSATDQPTGLAAYVLMMPEFTWLTKPSAHFRIHYLPGSAAEKDIEVLLRQNEASLASHLAILQTSSYDRTIDIFYFDSRDQIKKVVMKPFRALADAKSMTVLAVRNHEEVARDAHEIMHVVSYDLWGKWDNRDELAWLGEGLATYADKPCNGHNMTELAAHLMKNTSNTPPLDSLAMEFRKYPEMIGYPLMASFVEFVLERFGPEYLHRLWLADYADLGKILGEDRSAIEQQWREYVLGRYPLPSVPDWAELQEHGCR
ncbi:MAG: hypothetical protein ABIE70_12485 [bacterium]